MFAQIIAICIFVTMFLLIILDKFERHYITLGSGALVLVLVFGVCMRSMSAIWETLNLGAFFQSTFWYGASEESTAGINWSTILFIAGMMIMVEGLGKAGFFRWLCLTLAKLVHYRTVPLLICFMSLSAFLSMFIDSITVVLFLATVTLELAQTMKFDPVPMILSEIFCANLGGAATMCGDPPNIIIGTSLGYTFFDFIENTGAVVAICFVFMLIYFTLCFRKELERAEHANGGPITCPEPSTAITNKKAFLASAGVFLLAVVLLITHAQTELSVACIGVIVAILTLIVLGLTSGKKSVIEIIKGVDYKTLLFFIGLFVSVAGLEKTGVLNMIANFITSVSEGNIAVIVIVILWLSAITSAFVDNIPFAATMIPVIRAIAATEGMDIGVLAWAARTSAATRRPSARAPTSSALRLRPRAAIPLAGAATASTACPRRSLSWRFPRPTYSCAICKRKKERSAIP